MSKNSNIQLLPVQDFKIPIDFLSDVTFDDELDAEETKSGKVVESRRKNIVSPYKITNFSKSVIKLTEFDRAVRNACIAEQSAGNEYTSPERIYHRLGGGHILYDDMRKAIMDSVWRLASVQIEIEMEKAQEKFGYGKDTGISTFRGYLMPTETLEVKINGQPVKSAIHFLKKGIIFGVADAKDQIITCDQNLLAAPIRHTERGIALNHFLVRRTLEIKGSHEAHKANTHIRPLHKTILFETMLRKCGLENATRRQRQQFKESAEKILKYEVELGVIKSYSFETVGGGKVRAITLDF